MQVCIIMVEKSEIDTASQFKGFNFREFWSQHSLKKTTRWTSDKMLEFEVDFFSDRIKDLDRILDLGSGYGELSRSIVGTNGFLHAVDFISDYEVSFQSSNSFLFTTADVVDVSLSDTFDVVLLFGVITHLTPEKELSAYRTVIRHLHTGGTAYIKNQCSDSNDAVIISSFSDSLGCNYAARYPSVREQLTVLQQLFDSVEIIQYPTNLKVYPNTSHVMFVCNTS